jgi:hypothetical protein
MFRQWHQTNKKQIGQIVEDEQAANASSVSQDEGEPYSSASPGRTVKHSPEDSWFEEVFALKRLLCHEKEALANAQAEAKLLAMLPPVRK